MAEVVLAAEVDLEEASVDHHHSWVVAEAEAMARHFHHVVGATVEEAEAAHVATTLTRWGSWAKSRQTPSIPPSPGTSKPMAPSRDAVLSDQVSKQTRPQP